MDERKKTMKKTLLLSLVFVAALAAPAFAATHGALDGKTFAVTVKMTDGQVLDNTYSFTDGKVESALCVKQGYLAGPYTTKEEGGKTMVTAVLVNDKGDSRKVNATIAGDQMEGTVDTTEGGTMMKLTISPKIAAPKVN